MTTITDTFVPSWVALALGVATVCMLAGIVVLARRSKRAAAAQQNPEGKDEKALRRLFIAALIPTLGVIAAVMAISFVGLASFARDDMGWHSWIRFIVPVSLDGISITFGFWAFVAVKRGRHPGRAEKIVYIGALISAWINFNHGRQEWTGAAGIYLGFLSLASAWMFHELLAQFMDSQDDQPKARRHGIPVFGERWLWAFPSTLMARRAWVVYPPADGIESTPAKALAHREAVRERRAIAKRTKKVRHQAAVDAVTRQLHQPAPPPPPPAAQPTSQPIPFPVTSEESYPLPANGNRKPSLIGPVTR